MAGRECYHCKQWVEEGEAHDCWTTTEAALTRDLSEDLQDAWDRLREAAVALGEQRIYASHSSIMFSRKSCHFFVRPKKSFLELCVFLGRPLKAPQVRRVDRVSKSKVAHLIQIRHRDEVEAPLTDWMQEAYDLSAATASKPATPPARAKKKPAARSAQTSKTKRVRQRRARKRRQRPCGSAAALERRSAARRSMSGRRCSCYVPSYACCSRFRSSFSI